MNSIEMRANVKSTYTYSSGRTSRLYVYVHDSFNIYVHVNLCVFNHL